MIRVVFASFAFLAYSTATMAQDFSGTYSMPNAQGGPVVLTLSQDAQQHVTGSFAGNGNTLQVRGQVQNGSVLGIATGSLGGLYIVAQIEGQNLRVLLAEAGPDGQPNFGSARQFLMTRAAASAAAPTTVAPRQRAQRAPQDGGNPVDAQLTQLLLSSAWCAFSYNQSSGRSSQERVLFGRDGMFQRQTGGEYYSSGYGGTYASQSKGATRGRWRVLGGGLQVSEDGFNWQPQPLQITRNSNGYPVINSSGKEYTQCR